MMVLAHQKGFLIMSSNWKSSLPISARVSEFRDPGAVMSSAEAQTSKKHISHLEWYTDIVWCS